MATFRERYGVEHTIQLQTVKDAARRRHAEQYVDMWNDAVVFLPKVGLRLVHGKPGDELIVEHTCGHRFSIGPFVSKKWLEERPLLCRAC
jgi:hypothetical protein